MLKHADLWRALDSLAARHGITTSGLARKSGLDPSTFNKSKRYGRAGKPRWPTTESIAKVLSATECSFPEFASTTLDVPGGDAGLKVPIINTELARKPGSFDDFGHPIDDAWDEMVFPELTDPNVYALEVKGDDLAPSYIDGEILIIAPSASMRRGDRIIVMNKDGQLIARRLSRRTARKLEMSPIDVAGPSESAPLTQVAWMARIVWVSQ